MQEGELAEASLLQLRLVQFLTGEGALPTHGPATARLLPDGIGDLEPLVGIAADEGHAVLVVQDMVDIGKALILIGIVMDRVGASS